MLDFPLRAALPALALLISLWPSSPPDSPDRCEVRAYLLDKDLQPASLNGISAVLVTDDRGGCERLIPMTVVSSADPAARAPHCALRSRAVEGTSYTAALCAVGADGRLRNPKPTAPEDPADDERTTVSFEVPYFKAEMPPDHLCGPGCKTTIRLTIGGSIWSTRSFPCAANWTRRAPTCCLHHELVAECAELKRHLAADPPKEAAEDLDRIEKVLDRRVESNPDLNDCQGMIGWVRSALADGEPARALAAAKELHDLAASRFKPCERRTD